MTAAEALDELSDRLAVAHERLVEWGRNKHYPGWEIPYSSPVLDRLVEVARDHRVKGKKKSTWDQLTAKYRRKLGLASTARCSETAGPRMEIMVLDGESVSCKPDGGNFRNYLRYSVAIERMKNCKEIDEIHARMPEEHRTLVRCTYLGHSPLEIPREPAEAWAMMGVSRATYFRRKRKLLEWLAYELAIPMCTAQNAA